MILSINEEGHSFGLPVEKDVELVPASCFVLNVDELLGVNLECVLVAEPVEDRRHKSTFLSLALLERQSTFAYVLSLLTLCFH